MLGHHAPTPIKKYLQGNRRWWSGQLITHERADGSWNMMAARAATGSAAAIPTIQPRRHQHQGGCGEHCPRQESRSARPSLARCGRRDRPIKRRPPAAGKRASPQQRSLLESASRVWKMRLTVAFAGRSRNDRRGTRSTCSSLPERQNGSRGPLSNGSPRAWLNLFGDIAVDSPADGAAHANRVSRAFRAGARILLIAPV